MKKGTFQPHVKPRKRKIGFLARSASPTGRKVLRNRRRKGRKYLTTADR
ncbi:MAG: 50S ribosomal protein L34 [Synergistaceae bacterium]|nr:50S ribosomal protein L34 [Synergistaceae bacterium]MBQ3625635.1 50S ribosomal protein L34 [Synergistaceae bacterium]MBQ4419218.1 50S ribosomal protein L34 [Synergistaceae bacterium]MBQ7569577.1 50S ribosomal protein L34 [Synergistaceae bacterium]MBQ9581332.1 50S ribosomal protein L34 [Synergistaceae bacterium]